MREIELKVLSELMKNAKLSDRDLARKIGSSQPTVTRTRKKLEKEGYIKEYTIIPDFEKLGFELMAVTFIKLRKTLALEEIETAKKMSLARARESSRTGPFEIIMAERGMGLGFDGVFISLHEDYASSLKFRNWIRQISFVEIFSVETFLIDLKDEIRYQPLSFANLAKYLLKLKEKEKKE